MRIFGSNCLWLGLCLKQPRHQDDDEQMFADQLEQQVASRSVVQLEQPEPEMRMDAPMATPVPEREALQLTQLRRKETEPETEQAREQTTGQQLEQQLEQTQETLRQGAMEPATRDSHSPARLEEISICADVHQSKLEDYAGQQEVAQHTHLGERVSGVAIKDEIEIFTDVKLDQSGHYFAY